MSPSNFFMPGAIKQIVNKIDIHEENTRKLKWETQAVTVIKEKIEHYKATGNKRKLDIYEGKLRDKRSLIPILKGLLK